ncbi:MAG: DNA-3-methyladenine glycosylase [Candidatus Aenigmatarchaeota archaeon]
MKILKKSFYERDTKEVAINLLGKYLIREIENKKIICKIVEVEAYYGKEDPASRAYLGFPKYVVEALYGDIGLSLIYMVHSNWLLNIVAHKKSEAGAVLIRAVEPIKNITEKTDGPGKLTKALKIDKSLNGIKVYKKGPLYVAENNSINKFEIYSSKRIGVKRDLEKNLRFFIKDNPYVSKNAFNFYKKQLNSI